jgi:anaerobic selenocysteine-containing dehydrogenase
VAAAQSPKAPAVTGLANASIGVLLCDAAASGAATPWPVIQNKLAPGALVVSFSPYLEGYGRYAELVVPSPAFLESAQDTTAAPDSPRAAFALSPAVLAPREGTTEPVEFVSKLAGAPVTLADAVKARIEALHKAGQGEVVAYADSKVTPLKELKTADDLAKALTDGALWQAAEPKPVKLTARGTLPVEALTRRIARVDKTDPSLPLTLVTTGWRASAGNAQMSPLLTKVYQESDLRAEGNTVALHPGTLKMLDLKDGGRALLRTSCGTCPVEVTADPGVMPGVLAAVIGPTVDSLGDTARTGAPSIADICSPDGEATWRVTNATLRSI